MVAMGIKALHDKNVLHRDIKSDNVLCNSQGDIKLSDLGSSAMLTKGKVHRKSCEGTTAFLEAPEMKNQLHY